MLGALGTELLTQIQQAVCCMANTVTATPAPAAAVVDMWAASTGSNVPFSHPGLVGPFTSFEIENFSDTYTLQVILPVLESDYSLFWVPPNSSKVLAVSAPLFVAAGTITVYDSVGGVPATPSTEFGIQVTLLKGS
jgi:hypothetical protein